MVANGIFTIYEPLPEIFNINQISVSQINQTSIQPRCFCQNKPILSSPPITFNALRHSAPWPTLIQGQNGGHRGSYRISAKLFCKHSQVTFMPHGVVLKDERPITPKGMVRCSFFQSLLDKNSLALMVRPPAQLKAHQRHVPVSVMGMILFPQLPIAFPNITNKCANQDLSRPLKSPLTQNKKRPSINFLLIKSLLIQHL